MYTNALAKIERILWFKVDCIFVFWLSLTNFITFCLIFKSYVSKSKLRLLLSTEHVSRFKVEQGLCKFEYLLWDTRYKNLGFFPILLSNSISLRSFCISVFESQLRIPIRRSSISKTSFLVHFTNHLYLSFLSLTKAGPRP